MSISGFFNSDLYSDLYRWKVDTIHKCKQVDENVGKSCIAIYRSKAAKCEFMHESCIFFINSNQIKFIGQTQRHCLAPQTMQNSN